MSKGATQTAGIKGVLRNFKQTIHRHVAQPKPNGNRRQRRACDAMRREAEATNRTSDTLKLILSGKSTYAYKDKQP